MPIGYELAEDGVESGVARQPARVGGGAARTQQQHDVIFRANGSDITPSA